MNSSYTHFMSLEEELAQRVRQQAVVAQLGQRALGGEDLQSLMDETARLVAQTLGVEFCKILELLPGSDGLLLKAGAGWKPGLVGKAVVGAGMDSQAGFTLYSAGPVIVEDLAAETRFNGPPLLLEHGVVSGMSVIIAGQKRPYGVLSAHTASRRTFNQNDIHFLQGVANVLGAAIERKRVEEDLERRVSERAGFVRLLQSVTETANQADSVERAFQFVLDQVCAYIGWPVGHAYLLQDASNGNKPSLVSTELWHLEEPGRFVVFQEASRQVHPEEGQGLSGQVLASRQPVCFPDLTQELNFFRKQAAIQGGLRSAFAFPVMVGDKVVAVLEFFSTQVFEPDPPLMKVMANIGTQLGRVVERERAQQQLLHSEAALRESLAMFENLFESAPDSILLVDETGRLKRLNRQAERMFGYARGELIDQSLEVLLPERFHELHILHRAEYSQEPQARQMGQNLELYACRKDGREFPIDILLSPLQTEAGLQVIVVVRDITARRTAEEALRQSEARFRSIFEGAALGVALVDLDRRILVSNPRLQEMMGYSAEELRGMDSLAATDPADAAATQDLYRQLLEGHRDVAQMEKRYIRKDGQTIWGAVTLSLVRNRQGEPHFCIAMVEDITGRKQMEAELAEVQFRLMAGREQERTQLAQELHDVPLQDLYVLLYSLDEFEEALEDRERFQQVKDSFAEGLRGVVTTLRGIMGELRSPTLTPFGLAGAIREHAESFQAKHPQPTVHLDLMPDDQLLSEEVRLNLFRIYQQALSNVVRHAGASNVTVRFRYDERLVQLEIEDDGQGFVVPNRWVGLTRQGHLGLAGSAERAELIGGRFQVRSAPGHGAHLVVTVPRAKDANFPS